MPTLFVPLLTPLLGGFLANVASYLLVSVAVSALSTALRPDAGVAAQSAGLRTEQTLTGDVNPLAFPIGMTATGGSFVAPMMSHGLVGGTPNAYLTYVIEVSSLPGAALNRIFIDGEAFLVTGSPAINYGNPIGGRLAGKAWVKYYDGSQVAADAMLLATYGTYPERPWTSAMIGLGLCYAIVTFLRDPEIFPSFPTVRFEMLGIPLYDPTQDTSVGGSGAQRWATPSTWTTNENPAVAAYNIFRGITLPGGGIWGGAVAGADLPLAGMWFNAINKGNALVTLAAGGTEKEYRCGIEVFVSDEPAAMIEELLKACAGEVAEIGGVWKIMSREPLSSVYAITDETVVITRQQSYDPQPSLNDTYNGVTASYPSRNYQFEQTDSPPLFNATWEAEDNGRRLVADLQLPAVPYGLQVQRLQKLYIADERRWRRHVMSLPPSAAILEPLDTMTWSSTRNGYDAKLFSVAEISDDLMTLIQTVSIRERWPGDYDWTVADEVTIPSISPVYAVSAAHVIASFAATAVTIVNGAGAKRPAVRLTWDGANLTDLRGIRYQMRQLDEAYAETYGIGLARPSVIMDYQAQVYCLDSEGFRTDFPAAPGASVLLDYRHELYAMDLAWADPAYLKVYWRGHINDYTAGEKLISDGVLNSTTYQARIRPLAAWPTDWTAWETVTTGAEYV